jgi:hypothetical protein
MVLLAAACSGTAQRSGEQRRDRYLISQQEVRSATVNNAYEVVEMLRPGWLRARPGAGYDQPIVVYDGTTLLGGVTALRNVEARTVESMRYLDRAHANATLPGLPAAGVAGAIVITRSAAR